MVYSQIFIPRFMLAFLIILFVTHGTAAALNITDTNLYRPLPPHAILQRNRIPWGVFSETKLGKNHLKFRPTYGAIEDPVDLFYESIAPLVRIDALETLTEFQTFWDILLEMDGSSDLNPINQYAKFLIGNAFLEVGILRYLLRIVFGRQSFVATAIDAAAHVRTELANELKRSFSFVTPRIILDWIDLICGNKHFRTRIKHKHLIDSKPDEIAPSALLNIELHAWKLFLQARLKKLVLTGYENIDL